MAKIIDPWGTELVEDYTKLLKDFGLEAFDGKMLEKFPKPNTLMRRFAVFGGTDLTRIAAVIKNKKPFYALTGIMPSSEKIHFGTKSVIENMKYFQQRGAKTYLLIADLEASATRGITLEEGRKRALNFHIPAYIALGLDPKKTNFYFQSENNWVRNIAYEFSKKVTLNEFRAVYGQPEPARIMSATLQIGDILFPQKDKPMPGIIPVGADQTPHMRLTRDVVRRTKKYGFVPPSGIYHKFTPSLDGKVKMSKSSPSAMISIPEDVKSAQKKIKEALTGGRETAEIQRKKGGQPEKCMIFEMYKQHLMDNDKELQKIYNDCVSGKMLCGEDKEIACKKLELFMKDFDKKMQKAKKQVKNLKFVK